MASPQHPQFPARRINSGFSGVETGSLAILLKLVMEQLLVLSEGERRGGGTAGKTGHATKKKKVRKKEGGQGRIKAASAAPLRFRTAI